MTEQRRMHVITMDELMVINDKDPDDVDSWEVALMIFTIAELLDRHNRGISHITKAKLTLQGRSHTTNSGGNNGETIPNAEG